MMITPYILYSLLLFFLIGCVVLLVLYLRYRRAEDNFEWKMHAIVDWVHDIRTPASLLKVSLGELEAKGNLSEESKHNLDVALRTADKLLSLTAQLLDWQKSEFYVSPLKITSCDLASYLEEKRNDFQASASRKGLALQVEVPANVPKVWIDRDKMDHIIDNLLGNALKYTNEGTIGLRGKAEDGKWILQISDTGIGIPAEEQSHIFKKYYRAHNVSELGDVPGNGIGLLLTRRLVEQHQGTITFSSTEGEGTTFVAVFPLKPKGVIVEDKTASNPPDEESDALGHPTVLSDDTDKNVLLLAEDDVDMGDYLENALSAEYKVVSVSDGEKALEKARKINPDIIISDIVMPILKGDELCRLLKSSVETSHIPVILLTALSEREDIVYGLEAGATDYIIKPFDLSVLKARLRNVLQHRQRFRLEVLSMGEKAEEIDYSNQLDKEFLEKVMGIINQEMSNMDFSVNDFCRMVGMSRTSIYNKLKSLTGQGPQDLIRIMRLNKAKELLESRRHTIGEVSALVGFSDPKYFSTCFKKQFGVSPSKI